MQNQPVNQRRHFITTAAIGLAGALAIPKLVNAATAAAAEIELHKDDVILFQGDSITDWGRSKTEITGHDVRALGNGYAFMTAAELLRQYPGKNLTMFNRGISGNKVYQLADRWDTDCLALKPNVLSIMIGVNDFWHTLLNGYKGTVQTYHDDFVKLLDRTKQALPDVKLIICEPFFINGIRPEEAKWHPAFNEYQRTAKQIANTYNAVFVPFQSIFDEAVKLAPPKYWSLDGVHPQMAGQNLMAQAWLKAVKG